jgi:hypothetical protein
VLECQPVAIAATIFVLFSIMVLEFAAYAGYGIPEE